jgi:hypothetical protein
MESLSRKLEKLAKMERARVEVQGNTADNGALQILAPAIGEYKEVGTRVEAHIVNMKDTKIGTQINHTYARSIPCNLLSHYESYC